METLDRMRHIAGHLSLDRFVAAHDGLYALGSFPGPEPEDASRWAFVTQPNARLDDIFSDALVEGDAALLAGRFLRRIEKSDRNPWRGRISVGRAKNSDVIIRHPSVSKLHAHFLTPPGQDPRSDNGYELQVVDLGSSNGTRLNGTDLIEGSPSPVHPGDRIILGEVTLEMLAPADLYHKLRAMLPTKAPPSPAAR